MKFIHTIAAFTVLVAAIASAPATALHAQDAELRVTITSVTEDAYPHARAIVGIENTGDAAGTLTADDFAVTIDDQSAALVSADLAAAEDEPLDVLIMMDTSGTTLGAPLAAAQQAAKAFLNELAPADRVAVMSFSDEVHLLQDYTNDRALAGAAIDALASGGNTALYQATTVAAYKAAQSPARRKAIILLSDAAGEYGNKSIATRDEAIAAAENGRVPFFNIAQGSGEDLAYFARIADVSRGRLLQAAGPGDLEALYVGIGRLLRSQYVVTFDASAASGDGSQVVITVSAGDAVSSAEVTYVPGQGFRPTISIEGVREGETVDALRDITVSVSSGTPRVRWYVDDVNVFELTAPPYVFPYHPGRFSEGEHTLRAVTGDGAAAVESSVTFRSIPPPSTGGGLPILPIAAVAIAMVLGAAAFVVMKKRAPRGDRPIPADQRTKSWAEQVAAKRAAEGAGPAAAEGGAAPEDIGKTLGWLISRAGNDVGQQYPVGGKPVSVGAGPACGVRIRDEALASEEARIWVRGTHLMLHMFTRLTSVESGGGGGGWRILEPGDTFQVGQHTFEFLLVPETAPADDGVPNILREREAPRPPRLGDLMPRSD
jgi:VWFA-related protein